MKNNNKNITEAIQTEDDKSISDRLDKLESMLLHNTDKMEVINRKLDEMLNNINIRTVGQVYKNDDTSTEEETWYDELKVKIWTKK